jgi:MHS family proline/betaine transporter-like MFS transporter
MASRKFVFFSAVTGNILEYYDFTVYSVFLLAISKSFFPAASEFAQTLAALAVFSLGFITRPIGGIVFGYLGDRYGRKISLIVSMVGMTIPTFTIGLLPGYNEIGVMAPIILVILRMLQGLCISGEGTGAAIFVLEHYHNLKPGLVTGFIHATNILGTLIASIIGILISTLFPDVDFAWRFAFILGGIFGLFGFYLRLRVSETPIFLSLAHKKGQIKTSFMDVVRTASGSMFLTFCLGSLASIVVYMIKAYVNVFYSCQMNLQSAVALSYVSYASLVLMVAMPVSGLLSDMFGRTKVIRTAAITIFILILPIFIMMGSPHNTPRIVALTLLGLIGGGIAGSAYNFVISLFAPEQRFSGVGFSYNLGIALFGGTSPIIARWLASSTDLYFAPAFYIMLIAALFLIVLHFSKNVIKEKNC